MNLTDEELRIKVAEARGWKETASPDPRFRRLLNDLGKVVGSTEPEQMRNLWLWAIPNYPEDLNACAEFEKTLTDEEWTDYFNQLYFITFKPEAKDRDRQAVSSTARQRCIAFLKTKGVLP